MSLAYTSPCDFGSTTVVDESGKAAEGCDGNT
jgi:hypothetical protein